MYYPQDFNYELFTRRFERNKSAIEKIVADEAGIDGAIQENPHTSSVGARYVDIRDSAKQTIGILLVKFSEDAIDMSKQYYAEVHADLKREIAKSMTLAKNMTLFELYIKVDSDNAMTDYNLIRIP
jgi:hypothetical protein